MSADEDKRLVLEVATAVAERGPTVVLERYDEWFAEDYEWFPVLVSSLDGRAYRGRAELEGYWREFLEVFPNVEFRFGEPEMVDEGRFLLTGEIHAKGVSSGASIDRTAAYIFDVSGNRITAGRTFWTLADAKEFLAGA